MVSRKTEELRRLFDEVVGLCDEAAGLYGADTSIESERDRNIRRIGSLKQRVVQARIDVDFME